MFILKTLISRIMSYFVGILSEVENIFLPGCHQIFSSVKLKFMGESRRLRFLCARVVWVFQSYRRQ